MFHHVLFFVEKIMGVMTVTFILYSPQYYTHSNWLTQ